jgi:hypothetical protein
MEEPIFGFKLFQPWADEVVNGKLSYLIRSMNTKKRGRVAVIASKNIDKNWFKQTNITDSAKTHFRTGAIGEVTIKNIITCEINEVKDWIIKNVGNEYWENYPKYLIPSYTVTNKLYIWSLENEKKWKNSIEVKTGGMVWAKLHE